MRRLGKQKIKRSELIDKAEKSGYSNPNHYIEHYMKDNPDCEIENN